jgi:hypothetical protein
MFTEWQAEYAKYAVATFPVSVGPEGKKPCVTNYTRVGLRASAELALRFPEAHSFGFCCGPRSRLTVVDMDDKDPAIVDEAQRIFGRSPLVWRTGGAKFAMPFRHNGEVRRIRPIASLPIDILGAGLCVAPPSAGLRCAYEIVEGSLTDLNHLPVARLPQELAQPLVERDRISKGQRNNALFRYCRSVVGYCDDLNQFIDTAETWTDQQFAVPLPKAEIAKTCTSVWKYQGGQKQVSGRMLSRHQFDELARAPAVMGVFAILAAENGADATFMIADGFGGKNGWPRRLMPAVREKLIELGIVKSVRRPGKGAPGLYRWR